MLNEILDTLFKGKSIYYYTSGTGNIILTKYLAVRSLREKPAENRSYIPGMNYSDDNGLMNTGGNLVVDIGNQADRNISGNVTISGYIINQETKEPIPGVTVYIQKLSSGTISNAYGFYKISVPRGTYSTDSLKFRGCVGSLYDITPLAIPGNIRCTTNPGEVVHGYFSVSAVTQRRLFIEDSFRGQPNFYTYCATDTIYGSLPNEGLNTTYWVIEDYANEVPSELSHRPRLLHFWFYFL